jgi:diadenosine tetraphosphate (Ap4A) HIT family hydrolase
MLPLDFLEQETGMEIEEMPFGCRLCAEAEYEDNVIAASENFFAVPDIRNIVPGTIQVISQEHLDNGDYMFSAGHYPDDWFDEYEEFLGLMTEALEREYDRDAIWYEHGEKEANPRPGSVYHPHIVGVAAGDDIVDTLHDRGTEYFTVERMEGPLTALQDVVQEGPYYFYQGTENEDGERHRYIMRVKGDSTPSQLMTLYISELPEVKKMNREWIDSHDVGVEDGEEYHYENFRPADRFFSTREDLRSTTRDILHENGAQYNERDSGVVEVDLESL